MVEYLMLLHAEEHGLVKRTQVCSVLMWIMQGMLNKYGLTTMLLKKRS